jgi:glycosyltransferase involved in cell wall biosynthesis
MLLSIVIPSYNHAKFVLSTIKAAASIDIHDKEIIVIDDGSTDESVAVIQKFIENAHSEINIRLISRENRGLVRTLNEGLSIALGKYFYVVASDDIPIPEGIVRLVNLLESMDSLQFAMGNALVMHSEDQECFRPTYGAAHKRFFALPLDKRNKEIFLNYPCPMLLQTAIFRRSVLNLLSGWQEDIIWDDLPLFIRMLSRFQNAGSDFEYRPDVSACLYRQHQANTCSNLKLQFRMIEQALTVLCPAEWRDMAIARKAAYYCQAALRRGSIGEASFFLRLMVARVGVSRSMLASAAELHTILRVKLSNAYAGSKLILAPHKSGTGMATLNG